MVVHEKNLYMDEWDEVAKGSKGNGLERSERSKKVMEQWNMKVNKREWVRSRGIRVRSKVAKIW
jgi:hypothetical protein